MVEESQEAPTFVTLARAAKIVMPIADQFGPGTIDGAIIHILRMLGEFPIAVKISDECRPCPDLPELEHLSAEPLSHAWFGELLTQTWPISYDHQTDVYCDPKGRFLDWARDGILVSHEDVVRHLQPPYRASHEPAMHFDIDGVRWSFPQILAWAATRDPAEVARIASANHFGKPTGLDVHQSSDFISSDGVSIPAAQCSALSVDDSTMMQSDEGRRKLVGWLALVTSLHHCSCGSSADAESENWEHCRCLGRAYEEVCRFPSIAAQPVPQFQPQPLYGSFSLEWSPDVVGVGALRSDVLVQWPPEKLPVATAAAERECAKWLEAAIFADTNRTKTKGQFRDEALLRFRGRITKTGFDTRIWLTIAKRTERNTAGRKKSRGQNDLAT